MSVRAEKITLSVLNMRTRFPFRYGIASLTALPHLFVEAQLVIDGQPQRGIASEGLPPKWFTKNPDTHFREDLADMLHVIETAAGFAEQLDEAETVFDLWQDLHLEQMRWATGEGYPPLLWSLGVSLIERAVIDGFCRARRTPFADAVRQNTLGLRLGELHAELADESPADLLPNRPLASTRVRHTVGLGDPLTRDEIPDDQRLNDGLPHALDDAITAYGLNRFKIKLSGESEADADRLRRVAAIVQQHCGDDYAFTLDGNEQYREVAPFRELWECLAGESALSGFMRHLLFVEQPLHRDAALSAEAADDLIDWDDRPPIIVDESDDRIGSAAEALESGYVGTSHKNCKGVFKGVANACLIAHRNREDPSAGCVLSGEDLANVGPVALLQDLAVMATLGLDHVERNGHHYFRGLSMYDDTVQRRVLESHADLYRRHPDGFATLGIRDGRIDLSSVIEAPFGFAMDFDPSRYTPLDDWRFDSLDE